MSSALLRVLCRAQTCLFDLAFRLFLLSCPVSVIAGVRKFFCRVRRIINCAHGLNQAVAQLNPLQQMKQIRDWAMFKVMCSLFGTVLPVFVVPRPLC